MNLCVITGKVRTAGGGLLAGAVISIASALVNGSRDATYETSVTSDANGEFSFTVPQGALLRFSSANVSAINGWTLKVPAAITFDPGVFFADNASEVVDSATVGSAVGTGVRAVETGNEAMHKTTLHLVNMPVVVANTTGASFGSQQIYNFPIGRLDLIGGRANLSFNWAGQDIVADGSGDASLGTTATADATLGTTDVDIMASTAMLDPFVAGVGNLAGNLVKTTEFDGTGTAKDMFLNLIIDDLDVSDGASDTVLVTGTVEFVWSIVGL